MQFTQHFITISDPREDNSSHKLIDIIILAICGTLAGCEGWVAIEQFGHDRKDWLGGFLSLDNGIPSHDTIGRVFSLIDPTQFQKSFSSWVQSVVVKTKGEVIAIDGKTSRRSGKGLPGNPGGKAAHPLHLVSALATTNGVVLGQVATDKKSNEITAIPKLLEILDITGCLVTIDAMGTQADIAADIVAQGGDYLLALKGNQGLLSKSVKACFEATPASPLDPKEQDYLSTNTTEDTGHGRVERRDCTVLYGSDIVSRLDTKGNWPSIASIARVTATRTIVNTGEVGTQTRYYISNLSNPTAETIQAAARSHWKVENSLHWVLDMAMNEDYSRIRTDNAPANASVLRHIALNLIQKDTKRKVGVKLAQQRANRDVKYMEELLGI